MLGMIMQQYGIRSGALMASLTGKMAELDDLLLFPGVMGMHEGPHGTVVCTISPSCGQ